MINNLINRYLSIVDKVVADLKCQVKVIYGEELDKLGFGGIWGVGKASAPGHLPAFVLLSHNAGEISDESESESKSKKSICLVGKGIVYDTGG